jgi:nicotinamide riboside kinase
MLISFTGAQSTGKSTLLNHCCKQPRFRKFHCIHEVTRKVKREQHVDINTAGDDLTQLYIINEHLHNHMLVGNALLDRCILDGLVYTQYLYEQGRVSEWVFKYTHGMFDLLLPKIDIIFYTSPDDVELHDDGERSSDIAFRERIVELFDIHRNSAKVQSKLHVLSGDVLTRYKQIESIVDSAT